METQPVYVTSLDGVRGVIIDDHLVTELGEPYVLVDFYDGQQLWVSRAALTQANEEGYTLPLSIAEIHRQQPVIAQKTDWAVADDSVATDAVAPTYNEQRAVRSTTTEHSVGTDAVAPTYNEQRAIQNEHQATHHDEEMVVPVIEEQLEVGKRTVSNTVRIRKQVQTREEVVEQSLTQEVADVQRIALNQMIDKPAQVRREGNTVIIPVMEEVLVVEKRLVLKEEVRITMRRDKVQDPQTVTLRREEIVIERGSEQSTSNNDGTDRAYE